MLFGFVFRKRYEVYTESNPTEVLPIVRGFWDATLNAQRHVDVSCMSSANVMQVNSRE